MKAKVFGWAVMAAFVALVVASMVETRRADASTQPPAKLAKQSSAGGDTIGTAADTSGYFVIPANVNNWMILAQAESTTIYTTQVSADGGTKWATVDIDTVTKGTAEATVTSTGSALFQDGIFGGLRCRVILDNTTATSSTGSAYLLQTLLPPGQ